MEINPFFENGTKDQQDTSLKSILIPVDLYLKKYEIVFTVEKC